MEGKTIGTRDMMRVCLTVAAAFLLIDLLLRSLPISMQPLRVQLDLHAWPLALGLVTGVLVGWRWQHPWRAAVLLAATLVVAYAIPYTIDTIAMVTTSDESIVSIHYATMAPRKYLAEVDYRTAVVRGRILSFALAPVYIGVPAFLGALVGRRLSRGRPGPVALPDAAGGASA